MCLHRREPMTSLQIQMDQSGDWKLQQQGGAEKFHQKLQFLPKRILQFVFSISVFSLFLWYSYGCSILPHDESINAFFSTFLFSISSNILERKYMFLLCNAILAFLAKTSLSISDTDDGDDDDDGSLQSANAIPASMEEAPSVMMARQQETSMKEQQVSSEETNDHEEQEEDAENIDASSTAKEDEQVGTARDNTEVMAVKKQDGDDEADETMVVAEENEELSNAEELNRKFEEFIRKMKEEIRIEAQRQLVAAV